MTENEIKIMETINNKYGVDVIATIQNDILIVSGIINGNIGQIALKRVFEEVLGYSPMLVINLINKRSKKHFGHLDIMNSRLCELG